MKYRNENTARQISHKEELKAENELRKLRFEVEYGIVESGTAALAPAIESLWLNRIYNFEQQYRDARRVKVYDFLGQPYFRKVDELQPEEIGTELKRIESLMAEKRMAVDRSGEYDDAVIYQFVTGELFEHEIDDVSMEGMITHFVYEEFHPNHEHDLRQYAGELIEILFGKKWDKFDSHSFAGKVVFKDCDYDNESIASIIQAFQEAHDSFKVEQFDIQEVKSDLKKMSALVEARIRYRAQGNGNGYFEGICKISFLRQWGHWYINGFRLPGFGD